jgi:hypothetical protein
MVCPRSNDNTRTFVRVSRSLLLTGGRARQGARRGVKAPGKGIR